MGWERPNVFAPQGAARKIEYGWGRQNWFPWHLAEQGAARKAVALFDMTSFGKFLIQGADGQRELDRLCANDMGMAVGETVYTGMLNQRGGYESDVTVARIGREEYLMITGTAQAVRDADWIRRNIAEGARATLTDVTSAYAVLALMGPRSRELLQRVSRSALDIASFPFGAIRPLGIGHATAAASRRTYVGELGWELYVPVELAAMAYDALQAAGGELGLMDAGYYALEGLRLEKGYRAWGRELTPDTTPYEAGLGFAVKLDKGADFIGRAALLQARGKPPRRRCVSLVARDTEAPLAWGGELVMVDGKPAGEVTSAGFGAALGRVVMLAMIETGGEAVTAGWLAGRRFEVDVAGMRIEVGASLAAPYDAEGKRVKS
jgi:4-methylaminobutanoate oxidase (formaldehyde-forming)